MFRQAKLIVLLLWIAILSSFTISFIKAQEITKAYIPFTFQADLPAGGVVLDDDTALVSHLSFEDGSVDVYVRNGANWNYQATLTPNDNAIHFGVSIALQGNTAIVGASGFFNQGTFEEAPGSVYVFVRTGTYWTQTAKLSDASDENLPLFGYRVDLDGNTIVVSSRGIYDNFTSSAYFFEFDGWHWAQTAVFVVEEGNTDTTTVVLDEHTALANGDGEVPVYKRSGTGWVEQTVIHPPTWAADMPLALNGNTALIGPYVYVTDGTNWTLQQQLMPNGKVTDYVNGVALLGDTLLLNASVNGNPVHAYVFNRTGNFWTQNPKLTTPGGSDFNGRFTALTVNSALVDNHIFSNGLPYTDELLINGGFETDLNNDFAPDAWNRVNQTEDIRRCEAGLAFAGNCMFQFKGSVGEDSRLVQDVNLRAHDLNTGDTLTLTGFRNVPNTANATVRFIVTYAGGLPQDKEIISITSATTGYQSFTRNITLAGEPSQIRIQLQNKSTSGKIRFDALSLVATSSCSGCAALIPLPLPLPAAP